MVALGTEQGLVIGDEFGTQVLGDRELGFFAANILPLVDGTRSRNAIIQAAGAELASQTSRFLDLLSSRGILQKTQGADPQEVGQMPFGMASPDQRPLASARVTLYGMTPWGVEAACHLARAGVGRLTLVDPDSCTDGLQVTRAIVARLSKEAASCNVLPLSPERLHDHLIGTSPDLVLVTLRTSDTRRFLEVSSSAHTAQTPQLYGTVRGLEGVSGPLVLPGTSACWNCWRLRETACAPLPWAERLVQAARENQVSNCCNSSVPEPIHSSLGSQLAITALRYFAMPESVPPESFRVHNFVTGATTEHRFVPMPRCRVCRAAATRVATLTQNLRKEVLPIATVARRLQDFLVDDRAGIVRYAGITRSQICPTLIRAHAELSVYTEDSDLRDRKYQPVRIFERCGGRAFTEEEALISALSEAVERYSAAVPPTRSRTARARDLDGDVLDPRSLILYSAAQYARTDFPYRPYDPDKEYQWVRGEWLGQNDGVWLPAEMVYYLSQGGRLAQGTSNGLAAGKDWEDAAYRATLEVVERDALLKMWFTRTASPRLEIDPDSDDVSVSRVIRLIQDLEANGLSVQFHLLSAAGDVPTVLCLGLGDGLKWPAVTVSCAAHPSARRAVEKAALEQAQTALSLLSLVKSGHPMPSRDAEVRTFFDHALRYAKPGAHRRLSFIIQSKHVVRLGDLKEPPVSELTATRLAIRLGTPIAIADVTSADVAATGMRVVRALIPGLQPLHCGAGLERLGDSPLLRLGRKLNTAPHPMC